MTAVTLTEAQANLDRWVAAGNALSTGRSYSFTFPNGHSRTLTRNDADQIRNQIAYWHRVIQALDARAKGLASPGIRSPRWT